MMRSPAAILAALGAAVVTTTAVIQPAYAADPFALIVVPDTQNYTDFENINNQYNVGQMNWIRDNMTNMNIKFVMHLGDFQNGGNPYRTQAGNIYEPDMNQPVGNAAARADKIDAWNRADAAIQVLDDNHIPYSLVPGNHDYLDHDTKTEPYLFLKTFGPQRYLDNPKFDERGQKTYGGSSPASSTFAWKGMNTYHRFNAGGYQFLNLALQFDPDDNDLAWAQKIINENPGLPTIVTTHAYVNTKPAGSDYQHPDIFTKLIENNPQIVMTFNGHLTGTNYVEGTNIAGKSVHQMLVDFQASQLDTQLGKDYYRGAGVLRQVLVNPDTGRVDIKDYSTFANKFLPRNFTAPNNDGGNATYSTPASFNIDFAGQFGLPNKAGITKTVSFRDGVNGYTGTADTYIDANDVLKNHGTDPTAWVDGDHNGDASGNPDAQGLLRFTSLISADNVPAGAMIESAKLTLHTSTLPDSQSPNTIGIYRLLVGWTQNVDTWDTLKGMLADGNEALLAPDSTVVPDVAGAFVTFDVTESVQTWASGAPNRGWALLPGGANGWQWDTSDNSNINFRPELDITYRIVPEPSSAAAVVAAAGLLAAARPRRRTA